MLCFKSNTGHCDGSSIFSVNKFMRPSYEPLFQYCLRMLAAFGDHTEPGTAVSPERPALKGQAFIDFYLDGSNRATVAAGNIARYTRFPVIAGVATGWSGID